MAINWTGTSFPTQSGPGSNNTVYLLRFDQYQAKCTSANRSYNKKTIAKMFCGDWIMPELAPSRGNRVNGKRRSAILHSCVQVAYSCYVSAKCNITYDSVEKDESDDKQDRGMKTGASGDGGGQGASFPAARFFQWGRVERRNWANRNSILLFVRR